MRIAHLADLHLGRVFHGSSLIDDQQHVLQQCLDHLRQTQANVLLLAGDLYDRALPGREAVRLFDWFLREVQRGIGIPVIAIAGNHDSGDHLGFGSWLFASGDVHLRGRVEPELQPIVLEDRHGDVVFYPLPYVEPDAARDLHWLEDAEGALTHRDLVDAMLAQAEADLRAGPKRRSVVVAHAFVRGVQPAEESKRSERTLYLGGLGAVPAERFKAFDYTALGHLHRPQNLTPKGSVRYAGSLLKYSFDECHHDKGMTLVTLEASGLTSIEHLPLVPRRDLCLLDGTLDALLTAPEHTDAERAFVSITLRDCPPPLQAMERLRKRFPYAAELHFVSPTLPAPSELAGTALAVRDPESAFVDFFERHAPGTPTEAERTVFREALKAVETEGA